MALTIQSFFVKVMSLLFSILSKFVIAFLPKNVSFNLMAEVTVHSDFGAQENKVYPCFHFSPSICCEVIDLMLLQEGGPLPGPETGLLSNTQK